MLRVLVLGEEHSFLELNAPSAADLLGAFQRGGVDLSGHWVGPAPRVTRSVPVGRFVTRVAWLYEFPDTANFDVRSAVASLRVSVQTALDELSAFGWQPVSLQTFSEARHGSVSWWQSGGASITRTRDEFPTGTGRLDAAENPIGPTTAETHPTSGSEAITGAVSGASQILWPVAILAGLFFAWPYLSKANSTARREPARPRGALV